MAWPEPVLHALQRLTHVERVLKGVYADRDAAVELLTLAVVCRENVLLLGPPGTAKTELLSRFTRLIDARGFHYLLTRFTEPTELFGPLDLEKFQQGTYHIRTDGMLPEAEIAFLDEVFQGSSAILNALLTLVNERVFHNGSQRQHVPLISLVGASNTLPDDPWLRAFADRFILRLEVRSVDDDHLEDLLDLGWQLERQRIEEIRRRQRGGATEDLPEITVEDLAELHGRLAEVRLDAVRPLYSTVLREIRAEGVELSDRRAVRGLKLIAGAALLRRANVADAQDFWPLEHLWTRPEEAETLTSVIQPRVAEAGGRLRDTTRPAQEILADLEVLVEQEVDLRGDVALGAHLMALGRLRREALFQHPTDGDLRGRIEAVIQGALGRLEEIGG